MVVVKYDPKVLDYGKLVKSAQGFRCASKVYAHTQEQFKVAKELAGSQAVYAKDPDDYRLASTSDQRYYLTHSYLKYLPLCEFQKTKINSAIYRKETEKLAKLLSPRQVALANRISDKLDSNASALSGVVAPSDDSKLGAYVKTLNEKLSR